MSLDAYPQVFLLPGMGADRAMYVPPWETLPNVRALDWPPFQGETTLAEVARKMVAANSIQDGCVLVGSSLGGMVAGEIAQQVRASALVLVSSAKSKEEIGRLLAAIHPLADLTPLELIRQMAQWVPSEVAQMFHRSNPDFIRAMCRAIFQWDGLPPNSARVLRIHGRRDHVIPPPADVDFILDGGHLITLTHPNECVAIVRDLLDGLTS